MENVAKEFKEIVEKILIQNLNADKNEEKETLLSVHVNKFIEKLGGEITIEDGSSDLGASLAYIQILMFEYLEKQYRSE